MSQPQVHRISSGGVTLHAVTQGEPEHPALVLVHGYPDNLTVWDKMAGQLARHYFVVRYDVRGAGRSDKPRRTRDYRMSLLAADLRAVADELLGGREFHLVAHDWGSIQSWETVTTGALEGRIRSYTSISGPCLDHVGYWLRERVTDTTSGGTFRVLRQLASSWYVFMFQLPLLPEALWQLGLDRLWPGYLRKYEQVEEARFSPLQKADGQFGVKLYRANFLPKLLNPEPRPAACPVQVIIPTRDAYVGPQLAEPLARWVDELTVHELDAPHWALVTEAHQVSALVHRFAQANTRA
ncbi:MAG TPA: alpha/beta fold hydrolase [Marinobacter sp.]|nr:alpha/beta fold hydrolase [Marinobacter sp.]